MVGMQFFVSGTLMILAIVMFSQNRAMTNQLDGNLVDPKIAISTPIDTYTVDPDLLIRELEQHPAILSVTRVDTQPWEIRNSSNYYSRTRDTEVDRAMVSYRSVGYDYLKTMGIPLLGGRDFSRDRVNDRMPPYDQITPSSGPFSVLVDDEMAQAMGWNNAVEAIGESIFQKVEPPSIPQEMIVEYTIIGAVGKLPYHFIDFGMFGTKGHLYRLRPENANSLLVRVSRQNLNDGLVYLDETWRRLMPTIALKRQFIDELFYDTYNIFLTISTAIGTLSIIGFLIASIGLLGNATFLTNIRQKEVGIRKVMGASSNRLLACCCSISRNRS